MKIEEIIGKAKLLGISPNNKDKLELIHEIQQKEGYEPCCGTFRINCKYASNCCFAENCLGEFVVKPIFIFEVV